MNLSETRQQIEDRILQYVRGQQLLSADNFPEDRRFRAAILTMIRAMALAVYIFIDAPIRSLYKSIWPRTSPLDDAKEHLIRNGLEYRNAIAARLYRSHRRERIADRRDRNRSGVNRRHGRRDDSVSHVVRRFRYPVQPRRTGRGSYTVPLKIECVTPGAIGNVVLDAINTVFSSSRGIDVGI